MKRLYVSECVVKHLGYPGISSELYVMSLDNEFDIHLKFCACFTINKHPQKIELKSKDLK